MSRQKLILPINQCRITASYKTPAYKARFGFSHYGVDMVSSAGQATVYACGDGEVLCAGLDNLLGNVVVIRYDNAYNHKADGILSVIARCFHLANIRVRQGQNVTKDTVIGQYGNTGKYSAGAHLHLEFSSDLANPLASSTLGGGSNIMKAAAKDCSIDPVFLLHRKAGPPDNQTIVVDQSCCNGQPYALPEYAAIPTI